MRFPPRSLAPHPRAPADDDTPPSVLQPRLSHDAPAHQPKRVLVARRLRHAIPRYGSLGVRAHSTRLPSSRPCVPLPPSLPPSLLSPSILIPTPYPKERREKESDRGVLGFAGQEGWHVLVRRQGGGDGSEPDWQPRASVKQMAGKRKEARGKVRKAGLGLAAMGE